MAFILTDHGIQQLTERIGCSERKRQKLLAKAWRSTEPIERGDLTNHKFYEAQRPLSRHHYRKLMGFVFVFATDSDTGPIHFVTVHPPGRKALRVKPHLVPHD